MLTGIDARTLSFALPFFLWLLLVPATLTVLWAWRVFRRRRDVRRYRQEQVLPAREHYSLLGELAFWLCPMVAASLCIAALARPQALVTALVRTGADIVILQDGSASMYVNDVKPDRWRRSVRFLRTFADALAWKNGDRVALALFAHIAAPQLRLSKDPNAFFFFLDHLGEHSPFLLANDPTWDTNIEEGVYWGLQLLNRDEELFGKTKNPKAFVVISDGQAWSGVVAGALKAARARNVSVYVVGVGTPSGGLIPEPSRSDGGAASANGVRAVLDRNSLQTIARTGGGEYFEMGREPDRDIALSILTGIKRHAPVLHVDEGYEELYWYLLFAAALVLCLATVALKNGAELWWQVVGVAGTIVVVAIALG
jgi:Ca-activated chloride channel family protein